MAVVTTINVEYKLSKIHIDASLLTVTLEIDRGFVDANSTFVKLDSFTVEIDNANTTTLMNTVVTSGATIYSTIKNNLYQYLIAQNIVSGTIV